MTGIEAQRNTERILREAGVENAAGEARFILQDALGMDSVQWVLSLREPVCEDCVNIALSWALRRAAGEPLQYILGHTDFMGLDVRVAPGVLIPRPETEGLCELLAEEAKRRAAQGGGPWPCRILDLCTGSGCIAAWAGHTFDQARVTATDISEQALTVARENCAAHEAFSEQIALLAGDLFGALKEQHDRFDAIVSNPPYIPSQTVDALEPLVRDHEPRLALDGGKEGMELVRRIILQAPDWLKEGGLLLMEIDDTQEDAVLEVCKLCGRWRRYEVLRDLADKVRYLRAYL